MTKSATMPKCSATSGPVVWYVASTKMYYVKGAAGYGKGSGTYLCRATAVARGGKSGTNATMGQGSTSGGAMNGGSMGSPMPAPVGSLGIPNNTSSGPGSTATPPPAGTMGGASGNQGNTGAPGAGGTTPNNPASSTNSSPNPRPSTRP